MNWKFIWHYVDFGITVPRGTYHTPNFSLIAFKGTREPTGKDTVKSAFRSDRQCQHKKFGASSFDTLFSVSETCRLSDLKADFTVSLPVRSLGRGEWAIWHGWNGWKEPIINHQDLFQLLFSIKEVTSHFYSYCHFTTNYLIRLRCLFESGSWSRLAAETVIYLQLKKLLLWVCFERGQVLYDISWDICILKESRKQLIVCSKNALEAKVVRAECSSIHTIIIAASIFLKRDYETSLCSSWWRVQSFVNFFNDVHFPGKPCPKRSIA